jgi:hypothetical protein
LAHFWLAYSEDRKTIQQSEILTLTPRKIVIEEAEEMKRRINAKRMLKREKGKERDLDETPFSWTSQFFKRRSC